MLLTPDILAQIQTLAGTPGQTPTSIAIACGITPIEFLAQLKLADSEIYRAYHAGHLLSAAEYGQKVQQLANQGSGPAQTLQHRIAKDTSIKTVQEFYDQEGYL